MIIASGLIILGGFVLLSTKLSLVTNLRILGLGLVMDLAVSAVAYALHWGTFTGVMAAAFAGLLYSIVTWIAVKLIGEIKKGTYHPGMYNMSDRIPVRFRKEI